MKLPHPVLRTVLALENRIAPASFTVNALTDVGAGSGTTGDLRYCIGQANASIGADTINFSVSGTITLSGNALPTISDATGSTTITGPGANLLTIDANLKSRVFEIYSGVTAEISGVTLTKGDAIGGSGIFNRGDLVLTGSILSGNFATFAGGGIYNDGALTVSNSTISGNSAKLGSGGGIFNIGTLTIANSTISGNSANSESGNGGGIYNGGTLSIIGSTLNANLSGRVGGGLFNQDGGTANLTNTTLSGNTTGVGSGGAIYNRGVLTVLNSTITGNGDGYHPCGGIVTSGNTYSNVITTCTNSILSGNKGNFSNVDVSGTASRIYLINCIVGSKNSLDPDNLTGCITSTTLKVGSLGDYGGPTQTIPLLAGSPAINKGTAAGAPLVDQRGLPRTGSIDIGAFEVQNPAPTATVKIDDGTSQRSMVRQLAITFSEVVTFPSGLAAAIQLQRSGPGFPMGPVSLNMQQTGAVVTVSFNDPNFIQSPSGSLIDGKYSLQLIANKITGITGQFDGDGNGTGGDNATIDFHRLFGDADGNGTVTASDFNAFRLAYGTGPSVFDFDNDGQTSAADFNYFRTRYGVTI